MTRDQIVTFVTTATGYMQADDVAAAQLFVIARDRQIYDAALWKSSLVMCPIPLSPATNLDQAGGLVIVPSVIKRIVAMRTNGQAALGTGGLSMRVKGIEEYFRIDYDRFTEVGYPYEFGILAPIWFNARGIDGNNLIVNAPGPTDANAALECIWRDSTGQRFVTAGNAGKNPVVVSPAPGDGFAVIEQVLKAVTVGPVTVTWAGNQLSLSPASTRSPACQVARLFPTPNTAQVMNVLGKADYTELTFTSQEPAVSNSENLLIAMVRVDMLRRGGENGEAATAIQEIMAPPGPGNPGGLLAQLKAVEAVQEATNVRIIPEDGYGPEWGLGPYIRPYW